jgi:hypothetical protein
MQKLSGAKDRRQRLKRHEDDPTSTILATIEGPRVRLAFGLHCKSEDREVGRSDIDCLKDSGDPEDSLAADDLEDRRGCSREILQDDGLKPKVEWVLNARRHVSVDRPVSRLASLKAFHAQRKDAPASLATLVE